MKTPNPLIIRPGHIRKLKSSSGGSLSDSYSQKDRHKSKNPTLSYIIWAVSRVGAAFSAILVRHKKANIKSRGDRVSLGMNLHSSSDSFTGPAPRDGRRSSRNSRYDASPEVIDAVQANRGSLGFEKICKATRNFSPANIIGEGGFGTVYKGTLERGITVAIKRAKREAYDQCSSVEFKNEILALSQIEHLSLVRFYGYVEHGNERLIVVEYINNGTLREHLDGTQGCGLEIGARLDIMIDVAHAITYLHTYTDPPIIHRDIKSTNILITDKLRAKVADFGFARLAEEDPGATHISTQIKGTAGYLDPEYLRTYQLTAKSDVYSFGVLLVELITGRHPIESKKSLRERITTRWALRKLKGGEIVVVMDPRLQKSLAAIQAVEKVLELAGHCLAPSRLSRPSMKKCAEMLWDIRRVYREGIETLHDHVSAASTSFDPANAFERHARRLDDTYGIEESR